MPVASASTSDGLNGSNVSSISLFSSCVPSSACSASSSPSSFGSSVSGCETSGRGRSASKRISFSGSSSSVAPGPSAAVVPVVMRDEAPSATMPG